VANHPDDVKVSLEDPDSRYGVTHMVSLYTTTS